MGLSWIVKKIKVEACPVHAFWHMGGLKDYQWRIQILRPVVAERCNVALCTLEPDLTCRSGFATEICAIHSSPWHCMEVSCQPYSPAALPSGKAPPMPIDERLGGPNIQSGRFRVKKNPVPLRGFPRIIRPAV